MRCFFCKLLNYEYWPWYVWHIFVFPMHLFNAVKCKSLTYFTVLNPSLGKTGGFYGDSKSEISLKFPRFYALKEQVISNLNEVSALIKNNEFQYPFVLKPLAGERGIGVKIITNTTELNDYFNTNNNKENIIQEYADYTHEFGIFALHHPKKGWNITGINSKKPFEVEGDGVSTIRQLIHAKCRYRMQIENLKEMHNDRFNKVLEKGKTLRLSNVQNHRLGTEFINASDQITDQLKSVILGICAQIPGFYYGRFDIKANSLADIEKHKFKIIELNGAAAEPTIIYDQKNTGFFRALKIMFYHTFVQGCIAKKNIKNGYKPMALSDFKMVLKPFFQH